MSHIPIRPLHKTSPKIFERAYKLGSLGGFLLARAVAPRQAARGHGNLIFTGATAGVRGNRGQAAHAMAMHGRRALAQSLAHELGPQGIHVAHVVVDGLVDAPDTVGKFFPALFEAAKAKLDPVDGIITPAAVADAYFYLAGQPRSSWTFEMDLRPWRDAAWYNTSNAAMEGHTN